jgi:hypothetical protein
MHRMHELKENLQMDMEIASWLCDGMLCCGKQLKSGELIG